MKFIPHAYQRYCIGEIISRGALALWLDMGLGKTVITLTAVADLRYNRFAVGRVLVIAPKKVAETTWLKEAEKWDHLSLLRVVPVLGSVAERERALYTPGDVWVINRENVPWLVDYYRNGWPFDMVVMDEATSFKSHTAKRFRALCLVRSRMARVVELTGTPAPNGLLDLWAQMYLLDEGERLGKRITHYRERYFTRNFGYNQQFCTYEAKNDAEAAIYARLSDICVSMRAEDYLELPDCVSNVISVRLDEKSARVYRKLEREMLITVDEKTITAGTAATLSAKLLQLCNGAVYDVARGVAVVHDCKMEAFAEVVEGLGGQSALVFYSFRHDAARLEKVLAGTRLRVRRLETARDADDWNARRVDILLAHPASSAYGLNLQDGGNQVIWFGLTWSLELYRQAIKRLHRQGQKQKVIVHHLLVEGGRDEDVMAALADKSATQDGLIESLKARIERVTAA
jgi:SNF2 family DNA or RNA helicase